MIRTLKTRGVGFPGIGAADGWKWPDEGWELNLGPLPEQAANESAPNS